MSNGKPEYLASFIEFIGILLLFIGIFEIVLGINLDALSLSLRLIVYLIGGTGTVSLASLIRLLKKYILGMG